MFRARLRLTQPASRGPGDDRESTQANYLGKYEAKPLPHYETENERLYRIISEALK